MTASDHFTMLWEDDAPPPDVFAFLKSHPELSPRERADVLLIDQHHRHQTGSPLAVEAYFRGFPEVAADPELKLDLVFGELRLAARGRGEAADIDQVIARFPDLEEELIRQIEVAGLLEDWTEESPQGPGAHSIDGGVPVASRQPPGPSSPGSASATRDLEILERLGHGGMGVVYRARQVRLDRVVAVKMIRASAHADPERLARFRTEVQAVARLSHPNFVQIHEIGDWDGLPYFIMEYVDGGSLARKLSGGPLPVRQAAQIVETLARAMGVAHRHGIVHRDLKPANILLTLDGQPKITDFGLAKISGGHDPRQTSSGSIVGTPAYMAPEQAQGLGSGPAVDIHALGATLYEMLTGRPPFQGVTTYGTLVQVMNRDPVPPGRLRPKLPRELETICLKCLEKEPHRRYASAEALAEDLQAFLAGKPIRAHRAQSWELALRWVKRSPAKSALLGVAVVTALGSLLGAGRCSILDVSGVAVLSLLVGGVWHHARLRPVLREMTEQRVVLERYAERLQMLGEMTRQLMAVTDLDPLLNLLGESAARLANAELATIYLIDRGRGEVWSKAKLGNGIGEIRIPLGRGIAGTVAVTGEMINLSDPYADPRFHSAIDVQTGYRTRNLLTLPMIDRGGRVIGVFQVMNTRNSRFEEEDVDILTALAATAAVVIERARAHT